MLNVITWFLIGICVLTFSINYLLRRKSYKCYLHLPGPTQLPILGSTHLLDKFYLHISLDEFAYKYGHMYVVNILGNQIVVINSSQIARELMLREPLATITAGRDPTFVSTFIMKDAGVILSTYSKEWNYRRKIAHQVLRAYGEGLRRIEEQLVRSLEHIKVKLMKNGGMPIDPTKFVERYLLENLEVLVLGVRGNKDVQQSMKHVDESFNTLSTRGNDGILTKFPWLRHLPCHPANLVDKFYENRKRMMNLIEDTVEKNPDSSGIYKSLLKTLEEDEFKDGMKLTRTSMTMILHDLISAGFMPTRGSLLTLIKIVVSRPDVQRKIQEEIDRVIGTNNAPSLSDRESCPYTEATILESLRFIPVTPITPHLTLNEFEFHGILFPSGCTIIFNTWHINHSGHEYSDPYKFKPERFLDEDGMLLPATHPLRKRLMTFSFGKRSCIGEVFAKSRLFLFLASIMQRFTLFPPTDKEVPLFHPKDMKPGVVLQPTDFTCRFMPR